MSEKNPIQKATASIKNFTSNHKTAVTIVAVGTVTTGICATVYAAALRTRDQFLEERGLTEDFNTWITEDL